MYRYVIKRVLLVIPILLGLIFVVQLMLYFSPGDSARAVLGPEATDQQIQMYREAKGLNDPYIVQLFRYLNGVLHGDIGTSFRSNKPVLDEILARFGNTANLALLATLFGGILGIVAGVVSAVKQYKLLDRIVSLISLAGIATPTFWLALMLMILFSVKLGWLPASGYKGWESWVMPVFVLAFFEASIIMRMTRSAMLDVLRQDYMKSARAKGQKEFVVIMKHGFRNALIPIITILGLEFSNLLAGAILTETVFAIPGIGMYCYDAILAHDYPAVQGSVLFVAILCVGIILVMDLIYAFVDPRIKAVYQSIRKSKGAAV